MKSTPISVSVFSAVGSLLAEKLKARRQRSAQAKAKSSLRGAVGHHSKPERAARRELVKHMGRRQAIKFIKASRRAARAQEAA